MHFVIRVEAEIRLWSERQNVTELSAHLGVPQYAHGGGVGKAGKQVVQHRE